VLDNAAGQHPAANRHTDTRTDCRKRDIVWNTVGEGTQERNGNRDGDCTHVNSECRIQNAETTTCFQIHSAFSILN
jgi:hypothetical protein